MKPATPIRKQFRVAAYSSPAISALVITPMFVLIKLRLEQYPLAWAFGTGMVLLAWLINIGIYVVAGQRWRYAVSVFLGLLLLLGIVHTLYFHGQDYHFGTWASNMHFHVIIFLAVDLVILILQDLVVSREKNAAMELENAALRLQHAEAVNRQLMQQIQPHFLFNSLSTLKSLITISPDQASAYLVRLSGFLRASLASPGSGVVKVGRELELCIDYLEMQRMRFGEALQFTSDVPAAVREEKYLPVFSLQLLVENAIKHNVLTRERPLVIRIDYADGAISVINNLQKKEDAVESAGMGLNHLRERYKTLTGDPVRVATDGRQFSVSINVFAYEDSHP